MNTSFSNSKFSYFIVPIIVSLVILIPSYFGNNRQIEFEIFYFPLAIFIVSSITLFRKMIVFSLSNHFFTIKYPYKVFEKKQYEYEILDIEFISFIDTKDSRMASAKIEVHYKYENTVKTKSLSNDLNYKKVQKLINELRKTGVNVKVRSATLK